jgi:hypothetical protein
MPRRVYLLGLGLALVALALALTDWAVGPRPGGTEANLRRLKPGMPLAEVEAVFDGRPSVWAARRARPPTSRLFRTLIATVPFPCSSSLPQPPPYPSAPRRSNSFRLAECLAILPNS